MRRSELSDGHSPDPEVDQGRDPEAIPLVIVARVDRPEVVPALPRTFAGSAWVDVVVDRPRGERRTALCRSEGPMLGRAPECGAGPGANAPVSAGHRGDGFEAYEATGPVPGRYPACGAMVRVEMPRFAEPPMRLDLTVVHEPIPLDRARHMVELQSFSATGRVLLASRMFMRTRTEPT